MCYLRWSKIIISDNQLPYGLDIFLHLLEFLLYKSSETSGNPGIHERYIIIYIY